MPTSKTVAIALCSIGFGISLGCLIYSSLQLIRIHKRRKAEARNHPLAYWEPTYVRCPKCGHFIKKKEELNAYT